MNLGLWSPYVIEVCGGHDLKSTDSIRPGLAGSFPTFIVDERWVVKFFGRLFEGGQCWVVEKICAELMDEYKPFPTPKLVGWGELLPNDSWTWPYLIFEYIPGQSLGEIYDQVPENERVKIAKWMGVKVRLLHEIPANEKGLSALPRLDQLLHKNYQECVAHHQEWRTLPASLVDDIPNYLQFTRKLTSSNPTAHLIHADLTQDHLIGVLNDGRWKTNGVIDFGDALLGNLEYELVPLHLDLFRADKVLLKAFLAGYELEANLYANLTHLAMRASLLHNFNVFEGLFGKLPLIKYPDLETLAHVIWNIGGI